MGRRKWKLYQESMSMRNHNNILNNNFAEKQSATITLKQEVKEEEEEQERLKDWSPQSKCYFCVDGKLDSDHTTHGPMVRFNNPSIKKNISLFRVWFKTNLFLISYVLNVHKLFFRIVITLKHHHQ